MAQMEVIVNKLNRRRSPVLDLTDKENVVDVLRKDYVFESVGEITNALGKWYVDKDGYYTWEKGLVNSSEIQEIDYKKFFANYDFDWLETRGNGVNLGLIDTGITLNNEFFNDCKEEIISNSNRVLHHGNFIGGILCSKKSIIGLAEDASLRSIKYKSDGDDISIQLNNLINALIVFLNFKAPLILNISQGFNSKNMTDNFSSQKQKITQLIKQISIKKDTLIICAADDNKAINDILFPANMDECVSVGCIDEFSTDLEIEVKLNILTPMANYTSFDNSFSQIQDSGSSFSTAIIAALAACYLSKKGSITNGAFIKELKKFSTNRENFIYEDLRVFQYQLIE